MTLPGYLMQGTLSMYGIGSTTSIQGIIATKGFLWNTVEAVNPEGVAVQVGDSVLYKDEDVVCRLAWDNATHVILPIDKIVFIENSAAP
jgi:hypothetical protein